MKKFETGKIYYCRMICDSNAVLRYRIDRRTEKSVWITGGVQQTNKRRRVKVMDGVEYIEPEGVYSMSPILKADKITETTNI